MNMTVAKWPEVTIIAFFGVFQEHAIASLFSLGPQKLSIIWLNFRHNLKCLSGKNAVFWHLNDNYVVFQGVSGKFGRPV